MLTDVRHHEVVSLIRRSGALSVPELASRFGVSEATARRDLDQLAARGLVERVRGGARIPRSPIRPEADAAAFEVVAARETREKRAIARRAAALVADGDVVALDIGTTVFAMCEHLRERDLTVVTASLAVVRALAGAPGIDLVVMGGVLRPNYESLVGVLTESCLRQVRVDVAFMGASGIRPDGAVLDSTPSEVPVKRAMIDIANRAWLLADHKKFPGIGFLEVVPVASFTGLITDQPLTPSQLTLPPDSSLEVLTP
ncbi:DeoR/GlpR transcriptional regulator [Tessaracoccus sp. MC1627]|uniref:DeoR/GlpR family DNA-binding transcription regulator n=1 Tax=Tessaracoccus sp. MC1627 TaxID=2760312 RepID=UPI0016023294|nr:DeoR/GlpR family DNA-binding transcription regulator [Tessaracoccus sp. MC1627]MBB1512471.1 DeoR/GlpR transcriptional regulator [Tessaracoccus sp. MC1627]